MAAVLDVTAELLKGVNRQIQDFSGEERDNDLGSEVDASTQSEPTLTQEQVRNHFLSLKRNLGNLLQTDSEEEGDKSAEERNEAPLRPATPNQQQKSAYLLEQLENIKMFTETKLKNITTSISKLDQSYIERRHIIAGDSHNIPFKIILKVKDSKEDEHGGKPIITAMEIVLHQNIKVVGMSYAIQRIERECSMSKFLTLFEPLAKHLSSRKILYKSIADKYQDFVDMPTGTDGALLWICPQGDCGPVWIIDWQINLTKENTVSPVVKLICKAPKSMVKMDKGKILQSSPERFEQLVKHVGPKNAILTMIRSTCDVT